MRRLVKIISIAVAWAALFIGAAQYAVSHHEYRLEARQ